MPTPAGEIRTLTKTWLQIPDPNHLDTYSKEVGRRSIQIDKKKTQMNINESYVNQFNMTQGKAI